MNQKEKRELKAQATLRVEEVFSLEGFEVVGQVKQGVAVKAVDGNDWFVIQVIVKDSEKNSLEDALEEKAEADEAARAKAEEKAKAKAKA